MNHCPPPGSLDAGADARLRAFGLLATELLHDLRNELQSALMRSEMLAADLRQGKLPIDEAQELSRQMERICEMLTDTTDAVAGRHTGAEVPFDPRPRVEAAVRDISRYARSATLRIAWEAPEHVRVRGPGSFLTRILGNLLSNALRYARTEIVLTVRQEAPEWVEFIVEDDGPGVQPEIADRIFDPMIRGTVGGRTGFGLHCVLWAAHQMGGSVRYQPRPGGGASFTVALPTTAPPSFYY